jgi:hypothetical protein
MTDRLTVTQAAQRMGRDPSRVRLLIRQGRLHAEREDTPRGPVYWLKAEDVDAFTPKPHGRPAKPSE